jgi:excisionase family DNA binding protein
MEKAAKTKASKKTIKKKIQLNDHKNVEDQLENVNHNKSKVALSFAEACEATSLSRTRLYLEIKAKRIHVIHSGSRVLFPLDELKAFINRLLVEDNQK